MMMLYPLPTVSIVIPTFNSEKFLPLCLKSIKEQNYPRELIEILIVDGGSSDKTIEIAKKFGCDILHNPLKTGEAGKSIGVKHAKNEIIAFIDSDNILNSNDWLTKMVKPFENPEIFGVEPLFFVYRREDPIITRYCSLIGTNEPMCRFIGNYDHFSELTGKWTNMPVEQEDYGNYIIVTLNKKFLPTIGANGFLIKRKLLENIDFYPYLFDIDVIHHLVNQGHTKFAKAKVGIIHIFASNTRSFMRKQHRKITDYIYYNKIGMRSYPWTKDKYYGILLFILSTIFIFPLIFDSIRGFIKKRDIAWFYHPIASWITLLIYSYVKILSLFVETSPKDRKNWKME
jgi:glycosyltransferase involved in cell wall biosynthesis